jgi:hypothetical protein
MYKFRTARWHSLDLDKIYNCTGRSKEEALETELQTDYNSPASHDISCSCCGKIITDLTTHPIQNSLQKKDVMVSLGFTCNDNYEDSSVMASQYE